MGIRLSRYTLEIPDGNGVYLFNTYRGTSVLLSVEQLQLIKQIVGRTGSDAGDPGPWSAVIDFLAENGFVVPAEIDELALAIAKYDRTIADTAAVSLVIAPSLRCNMNCYYCYEGKDSDSALGAHDLESLLAFITSRLTEGGSLGVTWFGGEPLLSKSFIVAAANRLREICHRMGVTFAFRMVSNFYLLDEKTAEELAACGITSVQVTFDGSRDEHDRVRRASQDGQPPADSFDRILANIAAAGKHLRILARVNVSQLNIDRVPTLLAQLDAAGLQDCLSGLYFYPVFNYKASDSAANYLPRANLHFSMEDFARRERALIDLARAHGFTPFTPLIFEVGYLGCYASVANGFVIDHRGTILKCDHELGAGGSGRTSIRDFSRIDDDPDLSKWGAQRPESNPSCRDCPFLPLCYAHCPHSNLVLPEQGPRCPSYKYNWRDVFPIYLRERLGAEG